MGHSADAGCLFHGALTGLAGRRCGWRRQSQRRRKKSTTGWIRDRSTNTGASTPPVTVTIAIGSMAFVYL